MKTRKEFLAPAEAQHVTEQTGSFVVRALTGEMVGVGEAQAIEAARNMLAKGVGKVAVYRLHAIVEKDGSK